MEPNTTTTEQLTSQASSTGLPGSNTPVIEPAQAIDSTSSLATPPPVETLPAPPTDLLTQLQELMQVGGPVVWILCAMSVLALSILLIKLWQFARLQPESTKDVEQALALWKQHDSEAALKSLKPHRPVSQLVAAAMRGSLDPLARPQLLKDELQRMASARLEALRALLRPMELIAGLAPLLGLLGTVLGMITAFQQMEAAGSQVDPSVLSGGIWTALLTTAVGLIVAIPVLAAHSWLERKTERVAALMNDSVTRVFTLHNGAPAVSKAANEVACAA